MANQPESKEPLEPTNQLPVPPDADAGKRRGYTFESGEDVELTFDVTNYQEFTDIAICDPEELAKIAPPQP
jgi:hypothetical protein